MARILLALLLICAVLGLSRASEAPAPPDGAPAPGPPGSAAPEPPVQAPDPASTQLVHTGIDRAAGLLRAGDHQGALAALPPRPDPDTYALQRWFVVRAGSLAAAGDAEGALDAADAALGLALGSELLPARVAAGEAFLAAGRTAHAARFFLDAASSTQALYDGALRRDLLEKLQRLAPVLSPYNPDEQELLIRLGELLERFQMHEEAIALYRRAGWHDDGLTEALLSIAWNYGELSERELAVSLFRQLVKPDRHEVRIRTLLGQQLLRLDRREEAAAELARALEASEPGAEEESRANRHTARALEMLVDMAIEAGDLEGAYQWLVRAPFAAYGYAEGERAAWEVFLAAYAARGPGDDLTHSSLLLLERSAMSDSEFRFWRWRAARETGEQADLLLGVLLKEQPLTYHGLAARALTAGDPCMTCLVREGGAEVVPDAALLQVPLALYGAGLKEAAAGEMRRYLRRHPLDWRAHHLLSEWEAEAGRYRESISMAWQASVTSNLAVPPVPVMRRLYPVYFQEVVEAEAERQSIDPLFLYSLMREESSFEHRALSSSNAHGLLQLLPSTAEWQAEMAGMTGFTAEMLYQPEVNVRLGAAFVRWLLDRFDSNYTLAAAAYNAGPYAVDGWVEAFGTEDMVLFIERIPYRETREYTRRVERNRIIYAALYGE